MSTPPCKLFAVAFVASLCALCATPLQAAQHRVQTAPQLLLALASAGRIAEDDDVRVRSGTCTRTGDTSFPVHGPLTLRGGRLPATVSTTRILP